MSCVRPYDAKLVGRDIVKTAVRKLDMLAAAVTLGDLRASPGNRLEALKGDFEGAHSIRVNDQWRIAGLRRGPPRSA